MTRPTSKISEKKTEKAKTAQQQRDKIRHARSYPRDKEDIQARVRARRSIREPHQILEDSWRQYARPAVPRPGSENSKNPRKAILGNALMSWSDLEECFRTYMAAAVMTELMGEEYVVDHTVPLNHPLVCGLHAHTNLRVISARENRIKSNRYWPDMPEITWATLEFLVDYLEYSPQY